MCIDSDLALPEWQERIKNKNLMREKQNCPNSFWILLFRFLRFFLPKTTWIEFDGGNTKQNRTSCNRFYCHFINLHNAVCVSPSSSSCLTCFALCRAERQTNVQFIKFNKKRTPKLSKLIMSILPSIECVCACALTESSVDRTELTEPFWIWTKRTDWVSLAINKRFQWRNYAQQLIRFVGE